MAAAALAIAEVLGEDSSRVKERNIDWAKDMLAKDAHKRGVIVDLHIGRTRFETKITKEDLGLDMTDADFQKFTKDYYDFGCKLLLPKRALAIFGTLESRGRNNLYKCSFPTPWGRFVPMRKYQEFKLNNEKHKAEYFKEMDKLVAALPTLSAEILREYRTAGINLYERTPKTKPIEQFVDDFVAKTAKQIPSAREVSDSFVYEEEIFYVPIPSEVEEENLKAEVLRREVFEQQAATESAKEKVRMELVMHRDAVQSTLKAKQEKVNSLIETVEKELGGAIFGTVNEVLKSLTKRTTLSESMAKKLRDVVKHARDMNFMDLDKIEEALVRIEDALQVKLLRHDKRSFDSIMRELADDFREFALDTEEEILVHDEQFLI